MLHYRYFQSVFILLFFCATSSSSFSQEDSFQAVDGYRIYYSVFSSTSLSAEMARRYDLVRGEDRAYINIAIVPENQSFGGVKATVTGSVKNLIQQEKILGFKEIEEPNAIYYLAMLRHTNREIFHFSVMVDPIGEGGPYELAFTKELFINP